MRQPSALSSSAKAELLTRIESFRIDEGEPALSFARRLARENGWGVGYAERVIREYKRFAYLCVVAGHVVSPSEDVDQAWHLHLTYTRSYWKRFCGEVLGTELHHDPTRGGLAEGAKHRRLYAETLASYERHFGEAPPADIWPDVEERFAAAGEGRWVDPSRFWVVPKPRWFGGRPVLAAAVIGVWPVAAVWNPLDFDGPTFLAFYAAVAGAAVVAGLVLRYVSKGDDGSESKSVEVVDPYEAAYLSGGKDGVVQAALTALARRGNLAVTDGKLTRGDSAPPLDAPAVERAMYDAVPAEGAKKPREIGAALAAAKAHAADYRDRLRDRGLVQPDASEPLTKRWVPALILATVTLLGVAKIVVGLSRDKPVAFLGMMTIATAVATVLFLRRGLRTPRGDAAFESLKTRHRLLTAGNAAALAPADAAMLVALFGTGYLVGSDLMPFHDLRRQAEASSGGSGCSGSSGCSGGDGGGCGGGCGGCGGGGD